MLHLLSIYLRKLGEEEEGLVLGKGAWPRQDLHEKRGRGRTLGGGLCFLKHAYARLAFLHAVALGAGFGRREEACEAFQGRKKSKEEERASY